MNILLLYATNSGGTEMAASTIVTQLSNGHTVEMKRVVDAAPESMNNFDLIVLGSPSWDYDGKEGQPHDDFWTFKKSAEGKVPEGKKFAIFGLGDTSYKIFTGAVDELEKWVEEWKGTKIVDSLRMDKFFYNQAENTQKLEEWTKKILSSLS